MRKNFLNVSCLLAVFVLILSGCGASAYEEHMKNGRDYLVNDDYQSAIDAFDMALEEKPNKLEAKELKEKAEAKLKEEQAAAEEPSEDQEEDDYINEYGDALNSIFDDLTEGSIQFDDSQIDVILENTDYLPAENDEDIDAVKQKAQAIDYRLLNKNPQKYFGKLLTFKGQVLSIDEEIDPSDDTAISYLQIVDDEDHDYTIIMIKAAEDILEDDYVQFWGMPVGGYSFENVSGGYTNAQAFYGSHIEKIKNRD